MSGSSWPASGCLASDYVVPADGCASYTALFPGLEELEADTHLHVHKENNVLFPRSSSWRRCSPDDRECRQTWGRLRRSRA